MAYPDLTLQPAFTVQSINERMVRIGRRIQRLSEQGHIGLTGPITASEGVTAVVSQTGTGTKFVMDTHPVLIGPATDTLQTSGNIGLGQVPSATAGIWVAAGSAANQSDQISVTNSNGAGAAARALLMLGADVAMLQLQSHGTGRVVTRWGHAMGGYAELQAFAGNGLDIGTTNAKPVSIGTNAVAAILINATTQVVTVVAPIILKGYTVATLPAGTIGMRAYVTDAAAPAYGAAVVGGGAVIAPVFFDGAVWRTM